MSDHVGGLTRLLHLASPALPIGAYSYSQGLEWACEAGLVTDAGSTQRWIIDVMQASQARFEAPLTAALVAAWRSGEHTRVVELNDDYLAARESAELHAETLQMGYSLRRLLTDLQALPAEHLALLEGLAPCLPVVWTCAAAETDAAVADIVAASLWAWTENQVMAAIKLVPLGQTAGNRILWQLAPRVTEIAGKAVEVAPQAWSNFAPGLAIASARHETQYSRLFRS